MNNRYLPFCSLLAALSFVVACNAAYAQHEGHDMGTMPGMGHSKEPRMAPQPQQTMMQNMMQDVKELRALKGDDRERTYMTKMMDHHQSGIDMAKMAVRKSPNPAIVAEAKKIISGQTKEIGVLRRHLASMHKISRAAMPDPRMQPMMEKLMNLSGVAFDRAFVQDMVTHHQGAIDMANVIVSSGVPHQSVRVMAQKTITGNRKSQQDLRKAVS